MHFLPREFHRTLVSVAPMSPLDTGLCCPHESGDSLSEGSEHPPRHVWQVPEIDIACISRSGLYRVPCHIEPASRWWTCTSTSGLNKLVQCVGGSKYENEGPQSSVVFSRMFANFVKSRTRAFFMGIGFSHCVGDVLGIATSRARGSTSTGAEFGCKLCIQCLTMQYTSQGSSCWHWPGVAANSGSVRPCLRL